MNLVEQAASGEQFEQYRPLLFGIAYRMLGSAMEAEDAVQDSYLRYRSTPPQTIRAPKAFLSTVVTRLCLVRLRSASARHEAYVGPWLPEPIPGAGDEWTAAGSAELDDSISIAFLVLLESLTPAERAVFLLREVFDYEYGEIAMIVDKSEAACRQLFRRAKSRLVERRPRFRPSRELHRRLVERFLKAAGEGDMAGLLDLLAVDVTFWADGGGKARGAATRPILGRERVATYMVASARFVARDALTVELTEVNGEPGLVLRESGRPFGVMTFECGEERIESVRFIANPDKLQRF